MSLYLLQEDLKAHVLEYCTSRDVESVTVADSHVARHVLSASSLWKTFFIRRWNALNYTLDLEHTDLNIDDTLKAFFPGNYSDSRMYQVLSHAITPVPSYVDLDATNMFTGFGPMNHRVQAVETEKKIKKKKDVTTFQFAGDYLGGDRSVRSNQPFSTLPRVVVYKKATQNDQFEYRIGLISTGYYEITLNKPNNIRRRRRAQEMAAIGVATYRFHLTDKQPGWDGESYGYHGDDGGYFHQAPRGKRFGSGFGAGDTIGCGIRRILKEQTSELFFTVNGDLITNNDINFSCVYAPLFPVIGLDCFHEISVNYGQEPFVYDCIDDFFQETATIKQLRGSRLEWYSISDSDTESEYMSDEDDNEDNQNEDLDSDSDPSDGILWHAFTDDDDDEEIVFEDENMSE